MGACCLYRLLPTGQSASRKQDQIVHKPQNQSAEKGFMTPICPIAHFVIHNIQSLRVSSQNKMSLFANTGSHNIIFILKYKMLFAIN